MQFRKTLHAVALACGLFGFTQCGGGTSSPVIPESAAATADPADPAAPADPADTDAPADPADADTGDANSDAADTINDETATDAAAAEQAVAGENIQESFVVASGSLSDISGHTYETEIREVVDAGWWKLTSTTFAPNGYLRLSDLVNLVLRATGRYQTAAAFTGGICPSKPTLSYAIQAGILSYTTCPSLTSYPTLNLTVKAMSRAFKLKDIEHSDFFNDMVANYDGPNVTGYTAPYGVTRNFFKFAHGIDGLVAWSSSMSPATTTYGTRKVTRGEAAAFAARILGFELPGTAEGPDYWVPEVGTTWDIQLQGTVNTNRGGQGLRHRSVRQSRLRYQHIAFQWRQGDLLFQRRQLGGLATRCRQVPLLHSRCQQRLAGRKMDRPAPPGHPRPDHDGPHGPGGEQGL